MTNQQRSFDGIIPRRTTQSSGQSKPVDTANSLPSEPPQPATAIHHQAKPTAVATPQKADIDVMKAHFDASLKEIDEGLTSNHDSSRLRKGKTKASKSKFRRILKWSAIGTTIVVLGIGGWVAYQAQHATSKIFKGGNSNLVAALLGPSKPLKTDQNGNTNLLLLGTSESDPNHPGAQLTDSMMVASMNQKTHQVFLLSIPRDLWVNYDHPCSAGYAGKINATYECALGTSSGGLASAQNDEATAEEATATKVGKIVGADIHYAIHMNLAVIQKVVDSVGGVDIKIESPDPRGILDRNFDWRCKYKCYLVKYSNGPAHLSGTDAMWLAQARNDSGGYGLPRSNFDRENNQRKIVIATKDKATSVGFLANPLNTVNLLDALGSNIHTTIEAAEIKSFVEAVKSIPSSNITSIDILNDGQSVLTTGTGPDGSSIVKPVAGLENYSGLQAFTQKLLNGQAPLIAEQASVAVLNGGATHTTQETATTLKTAGFNVNAVSSAPKGSYPSYAIYDLSKGAKPKTLAALESKLGVKTASTTLPAGVTSNSSIVVIVGQPNTVSSTNSTSN